MKIFVYKDSKSASLSLREIKKYIENLINVKVFVRRGFLDCCLKEEQLDAVAKELASIRVIDPMQPFSYNEPLYGEIDYEKRVIKNRLAPRGILYDGFMLQNLLWRLLPGKEASLENVHVILTDRLLGTYDAGSLRYHARTNILGCPSIISISGIVEAPAKPREFYIEKRFGVDEGVLRHKFKGKFMEYNDPRITDAAKSYAMQCLFYHVLGEGFCEDKCCLLYNAHWQEEMINAQLGNKFCEKHQKMLSSFR